MVSPIGVALSAEESLRLKQFQSQLTIILYNHILNHGTTDNMVATKRVSDLISIINDLNRCNFKKFSICWDLICDSLVYKSLLMGKKYVHLIWSDYKVNPNGKGLLDVAWVQGGGRSFYERVVNHGLFLGLENIMS